VVLLFGLSGTGRTAFVNKATGFGDSQPRVEEVETTEAIIGNIDGGGTRVAFVGTPPFDNKEKTGIETMTDISSWITSHLGKRLKITAVLYFISIKEGMDGGKTTRDVRLMGQIIGWECRESKYPQSQLKQELILHSEQHTNRIAGLERQRPSRGREEGNRTCLARLKKMAERIHKKKYQNTSTSQRR
jgi:hypothetical protein